VEFELKNNKFLLVGIGEVLWDLLPSGKQLGGAPANFAYHSCSQGAEGVIISCIGDDDNGREILSLLEDKGIETGHIAVDAEHPTGTVTVELAEGGVPSYNIHEGVAWDFITLSPEVIELAKKADAVCFGSLAQRSEVSRSSILKFLESLRPECLKIFDINIRQEYFSKEIIGSSLKMADVLKINDEELPLLAEMFGLQGSEQELLPVVVEKFSLQYLVLTKGGDGSMIYTEEGEMSYTDCPVVEVADTVGAGDSFTATFAMGILKKRSLDEVNVNAAKVAAFVCSQKGAMPEYDSGLIAELNG
jgi:fructokinase